MKRLTTTLIEWGLISAALASTSCAQATDHIDRLFYTPTVSFHDSLRVVVRDSHTMDSLWSYVAQRTNPPFPKPQVDFSKYFVLLAANAPQLSIGDSIRIDSIAITGRDVVAIVRVVYTCNPADVHGSPMDVVRIKRVLAPIRFLDRIVYAPGCGGR